MTKEQCAERYFAIRRERFSRNERDRPSGYNQDWFDIACNDKDIERRLRDALEAWRNYDGAADKWGVGSPYTSGVNP